MAQSSKSERISVKTYVPADQKRAWERHADELNMSMSEFIRTMVQSGRQPFDVERSAEIDATPGVDDVETVVLDVIESGGATWEELTEHVVGDIEAQIEIALTELQQSGTVIHNGRTGRYEILDNDD